MTHPPSLPDHLSAVEAARYFEVTRAAVLYWLKAGRFPNAFRVPGRGPGAGNWRIPRSDVLAVPRQAPRSDLPRAVIPHGLNGYYNHQCRCDVCGAAHYERVVQRQERIRQEKERAKETRKALRLKERERAKPEPSVRVTQLIALEQIAAERGWVEALGILRMHIRATRLDVSLDAIQRGER